MLGYKILNYQRRERTKASREHLKINFDKKTHSFQYTPATESHTSIDDSSRTNTVNNPDKRPLLRNAKGKLKCYNCQLFGHILNCSEPWKSESCNKCVSKGYPQRHCDASRNEIKSNVNHVNTKIPDNSVCKYVKDVPVET